VIVILAILAVVGHLLAPLLPDQRRRRGTGPKQRG
jgi:hypothetical protein